MLFKLVDAKHKFVQYTSICINDRDLDNGNVNIFKNYLTHLKAFEALPFGACDCNYYSWRSCPLNVAYYTSSNRPPLFTFVEIPSHKRTFGMKEYEKSIPTIFGATGMHIRGPTGVQGTTGTTCSAGVRGVTGATGPTTTTVRTRIRGITEPSPSNAYYYDGERTNYRFVYTNGGYTIQPNTITTNTAGDIAVEVPEDFPERVTQAVIVRAPDEELNDAGQLIISNRRLGI